ncbi:MAG TPA: response regulator [Blastocatellia bacterium]|nr:response regulator [Blastocatellia bacterium]
MSREELTILLAEDDDGHAALINRNLRRAGVTDRMIRLRDGQELLDYLRREGAYQQREEAGALLVLLDIRMPRLDGLETLRQLKSNSDTAAIPVYMLTTTDDPREVARCFREGCNAYVTKPVAYQEFSETIRGLAAFIQVGQVPTWHAEMNQSNG